MKKSKFVLILFLFGVVCERYIFPLLDIGIGLLTNKYSLSTSKTQQQINELGLNDETTQTNSIGFEYSVDDDCCDDIECKNKIGFIK